MAEIEFSVASTWSRAMARCIDQMILAIIFGVILFLLPSSEDGWLRIPWPTAIGLLMIPLLYEALFCFLMNATPGKWIFNLKVLPSRFLQNQNWLSRMLLRAAVNYLSFFFSWAIYAPALWRYDRRHLPDLLAETVVVGPLTTSKMNRHLFWGSLFFVIGLVSGLSEAKMKLEYIIFEPTTVRVPDPFEFLMEGFEEE